MENMSVGGDRPVRSVRSRYAGIFVVSVLLVASVILFRTQQTKTTAPTAVDPHERSRSAVEPASGQLEAILAAYGSSDKSDASLKKYQSQLAELEKKASSSSDKQIFAMGNARLLVLAGNYDAAIASAQATDKTYATAYTAAAVAALYEQHGDNANAATYYKTAAERSPKTAPDERSAYNDYLLKAQELEPKS